jgi:hypothetical protein
VRWPRFRRNRSQPAAPPRHAAGSWAQSAAPPAGVVLGFADGSESELDGTDPRAVALKAVADVLMRQDPA